MEDKKLTEQQDIFCKEYIIDFNGTRAAIAAKYSEKTAAEQASRLLRIVKVQKRIKQLLERRSRRLEITAERTLEEIALLAFSNIPDYFDQKEFGNTFILTMKQFEDMPEDASRAISSIEQIKEKDGTIKLKIRLWDKSKNLETLCKHLGITKEIFKHEFDPLEKRANAKRIIEELKKEQGQ